jgi:hypothetical protein
LALAAAALVAGCSANGEFNPVGKSSTEMSQTELAAFAAKAEYPATRPTSDGLKVAAIVNRSDESIKVYNFGDRSITNSKVWVNRGFVAKVDAIPPQSHVTIKMDRLFGPFGNTFSSQKDTLATLVQLQTDDGLYTLMGPVQE